MGKRADMLGALAFACAIIIVLIVLLTLTACAQPGSIQSAAAGANPYCIINCHVTVADIEGNTGDGLTPTIGSTASTSRTRSTVIEGIPVGGDG
jgi:hypothetical protein